MYNDRYTVIAASNFINNKPPEVFMHINNTDGEDDNTEESFNVIVMLVLLIMLFIVSVFANTVMLSAFFNKKSLRTISNRCVATCFYRNIHQHIVNIAISC